MTSIYSNQLSTMKAAEFNISRNSVEPDSTDTDCKFRRISERYSVSQINCEIPQIGNRVKSYRNCFQRFGFWFLIQNFKLQNKISEDFYLFFNAFSKIKKIERNYGQQFCQVEFGFGLFLRVGSGYFFVRMSDTDPVNLHPHSTR